MCAVPVLHGDALQCVKAVKAGNRDDLFWPNETGNVGQGALLENAQQRQDVIR
jgi:hypothetical protein